MNKKVAAGIGLIAGALGLYLLTKKAKPCTEGTTKCVGTDLYACINGKWALQELNSPACITPVSCSVDADCPPGYVCENGVCVPVPTTVFYSPHGCVENTRGYWTSKQSLAEAIASSTGANCIRWFWLDHTDLRFQCPYCEQMIYADGVDIVLGALDLLTHIEISHPEFPLNKPPAWLLVLGLPMGLFWRRKIVVSVPLRSGIPYHRRQVEINGIHDIDVTASNWGDRITYDLLTWQYSVVTWKEISGFVV